MPNGIPNNGTVNKGWFRKGHIVNLNRIGYWKGHSGKNTPCWKGGITKDINIYMRAYLKEKRHRLGISKRYYNTGNHNGISYTQEYKRLYRKKYKALVRNGGKLSIKTIQQVYEDNIKKYGTLTCYLCLKFIKFGQDSLDHKQPLSRGGTNEYNNLAITHLSCNKKKYNKTEQEYRKENLKNAKTTMETV